MRIIWQLLLFFGLAWLAFILLQDLREFQASEPDDPTRVVLYFMGIVGLAIAAGVLLSLSVIPAIGDQIGHFFFNPNREIEKNPHADALACVARGDYEDAVDAYRKVIERDPTDTHAISEITHIQCDILGTHEEAADALVAELDNEWGPEDAAFLANRLVDVYWKYLNDAERSIPVLNLVMEMFPDTRHSANAMHRLREIQSARGIQPHATHHGEHPEVEVLRIKTEPEPEEVEEPVTELEAQAEAVPEEETEKET